MKKLCIFSFILAMSASLLPAGVFAQDPEEDDDQFDAAAVANAPASAWPVKFGDGNASFVVYQPQFDKWDNHRLEGRSAVAVTKAGADSPEFGVVWLSAQTQASAGTVTIRDLSVTKADFPTDSGGSGDYVAAMRRQLAAKSWQVAQERLQNDLEIDKVAGRSAAQPVKNDVPQILFSQEPAILVPIDGVPAMRDVSGTGLKRIVNTRALMLFDPVLTHYYLYVSDHWMEARKFEGPWTRVDNAPAQLEQAREIAVKDNQVDLLAPDEDEGPMPKSPAIHVSTTPTELLQTDGPPQYSPVENTRLLYVTNSSNRIFLDTATQAHYVLISGRWFRARNLGPDSWEYVSAASLPGDFARIPSTHPTESVRAAVAGTPQAREAAIENTIPQVATVTRSAASLSVTYDGDPSFQPIDGTSLQQAVNAPIPVIRVSENSFYALDNGVWFVASSPFGPWGVASSVPAVVYSIPRSSPLHYVTYVRIYDATPDVVYVGYTPGYVGSYVSSDYVVVYGTGWHYRPWIGSVWYSAPVTWGFGFSFVHTWWRPWRPHYVVWVPPAPCFRPAWGPWHHRPILHRALARSATVNGNVTISQVNVRRTNVANIYGRWDRKAVAVNRNAQPRPQHAGAPGPGRGYITRPDGSRREIGERDRQDGRRDWNERRAQRRDDNDRRPPAIQTPRPRRDNLATPGPQDRIGQSGAELPRIQGPSRRWERDQDGRRVDRERLARQQRRDVNPGGPRPPVAARPQGSPQAQHPRQDRDWRNRERRESTPQRVPDAQRQQFRNDARQEPRNQSGQRQARQQMPRAAPPAPPPAPRASAPARQVPRAAPQVRQQRAAPPRAQNNRGGSIRQPSPQARGGERGGIRRGDGNNFRPQMR
jgi:hypothetical protein